MFPFDSKVLALRRGIMQIDHFASHHGCWLGWYSGWSNSRLGVGQRSRKQCSFIRLKCLHPSRDSLQRLVFEAAPDGQHVRMPRIKSAEFRPIRVQNVPIHHQSQMSHLDAFWVANEWQGISSVTLTFAT